MKKILKPATHEEAVYYSDFTGKVLDNTFGPQAILNMSFNFGSDYDGKDFTLHLSEEDANSILEFLYTKLLKETKNRIQCIKS